MKMARGCGWVMLGVMFVIVACLIFATLAVGLFRTGELPLYAPRLTGLQPHPNSAFRPTTPITLTFDQPMNPASVEGAFVLEPGVSGGFRWNEDRSQVTFLPGAEGFEPGTTYSVQLEAGAEAGTFPRTTGRSVQWSFSLPPLLDRLEPPPGAESLGPRPALEASFNYPLDCTATFRTFSMTPDAAGVLGCKDSTLTFDPSVPLEPDTGYAATLAHVFLEGDPTPRPGVEWAFRTAPALVVDAVLPEDEGLLDDLWSPFTVAFNRPVEPESAVSRFSLTLVGGIPVEGEFSWQQEGAALVFQPDEPLEPAMRYDLVVDSGVQDLLGYELAEAQRWSYETPPMLGSPAPSSGSRGVALDGTIQVPFARPMDKASVEAGVVVSPALEADRVWEGDTLILVPRGGFLPETGYQVLVQADVRDASGAPLAQPRQWTFETEPFLIEERVPTGAVVTELRQPVEFTFALPMDRASVRAALTISPTTPGELVWSDQDRTVAFVPDPAWFSGTGYEVTLDGSARTADRVQTLGGETSYAFTTAVAEARFGEGPKVQVVPTEGKRALQVLARGADVADFRLYSISVEQFLELYVTDRGGAAELGPELLAAATVTPTLTWREPVSPLDGQAGEEWRPADAQLPAGALPGLYVLAAEPPSELEGYLLLVLTDHVLVVKRAPAPAGATAGESMVVWDVAIDGASPVVSATLRLYDGDGALLAEGVTGGDGLSTLAVPGDAEPVLVVSESGGEVTVVGLDAEWSEGDGSLAEAPEGRPAYLVYAFTDQAVYGPSGTIHFKQFVRAEDDAQYTLPPPDLPLTVRLRDPQDEVAASQVLTITEFGTAYGSFDLMAQPLPGAWNLETEVGGTVTRTPLWVAEPSSVATEGELGLAQEGEAGEAGEQSPGAEQEEGEDGPDLAPGQEAAGSQESQISIAIDRPAFVPGQAAQVVITTPVSGTALVSLERGTIRQIETVTLVSETTPLSLPVRADFGPNVEVVVSQFGPPGGEVEGQETQPDLALHTARAPLLVPMAGQRLTVSLRADQESYGPGDDVVLQVWVTDHQDEPVVAELSLALVGGASQALLDDPVPDAFERFYGPRPNAVMTYDSMRPTRWLAPGEPRPAPQPAAGEGEEGAAPPGAVLDTAYWAPAVVTNEEGLADVTLQAPGDLKTWTVVARAITTDTRVGEATAQLVVTREISIQPGVPEVLVAGDVFFLTAEVHNLTSQPVSATVQLEQDGLTLWTEESQPLPLPAGGTATALWPAVAERAGESQLRLRATASRGTRLVGRDVVEVPLRIEPLAIAESATWAGALAADSPTQTISLSVPAAFTATESPVEIRLAPSTGPAVAEGLAYLLEVPHGCVEPVAGKLVAGAIAADAREVLTGSLAVDEAELLPMVQRGLQDLYASQHDEGGWSWCGGGNSDAYLTAYVLGGLARASEAGFEVDPAVMARGVEALQLLLPEAGPDTQAYGAYALLLAGHPATLTLSVTDVLQLDAFSQAALALAIGAAAEAGLALEPVQDLGPVLLESLEASAIEDAATAHWDEAGAEGETASAGMGSPVRTTALVTQALARLNPESELVPKAIRWLMGQRRGPGWGDTHRTSYAVLALAEALDSLEPGTAAPGFQVVVNGALLAEGQLDLLQGQQVLTVPVSALVPGENELQMALGTQGAAPSGLLYYAVTATSLVTPTEGVLAAAGGRAPASSVRRAYRLPGTEEPATDFEPGDLVEVAISLDVPEESWYVVIEDRLPAGFEVVGEGRQSGSDLDGLPEEVALSEGTLVPDRMETGAGRATFFFEQVPAGPQSFAYLVRAATRGSFAALPVNVYPMYDPEAWSRSASTRCSVRQR